MTEQEKSNREAWLRLAFAHLREEFSRLGYVIPKETDVHIGGLEISIYNVFDAACVGIAPEDFVLGQTRWGMEKFPLPPQIHVSENSGNAEETLHILTHEMLHAALPVDEDHGVYFQAGMALLGLEGKPTATKSDMNLRAMLASIIEKIGPMPGGNVSQHEYLMGKYPTLFK